MYHRGAGPLFSHELTEHRQYVADDRRLQLYRRALVDSVNPASRVLDLGAGSGILGLLACEAGAARVYAVDNREILGLAQAIAAGSHHRDRIRHLPGWSMAVVLPETVDLVVADQMDPFGVLAGLPEAFADARRRHLKAGGVTMPSSVSLFLAPVECADIFADIAFWATRPAGFDFGPMHTAAVNDRHWARLPAGALLAEPALAATVDLSQAAADVLTLHAAFTIHRAGLLHGLGGWFRAQLSPTVAMSNSPLDTAAIDRQQQFLPLEKPISIGAGARVETEVTVRPRQGELAWTVSVAPDAHAPVTHRFRHATFLGRPMTRAALEARRTDRRPVLSPFGQLRAAILSLCDGSHSIAEIEAAVLARHTGLFASEPAARDFVRDVIADTTT